MTINALEECPECGESNKHRLVNAPLWVECKSCGYYEDAFKGPATFARQPDPNGPFTQYL